MKKTAILVITWLFISQLASLAQFVKVNGTKFSYNGKDFYFQGTNVHHLGYARSGGPTNITKGDIDGMFQHYINNKITVVRAWAYSNRYEDTNWWPTMQNNWNEGVNSDGMDQLCYAIKAAEDKGLKLILALTNFEEDYGGMAWYVSRYMGQKEGWTPQLKEFKKGNSLDHRKIEFYWRSEIKEAFKIYVNSLLNYKNPYTGRLIKDEPAIMAWDLCNEPHTIDGADAGGDQVYGWLNEMASYVKSIDFNHLVTTGEEGYRIDAGYEDPYTWIGDGTKGVDFAKNRWIQDVDFVTTHCYPDRWREEKDGDANAALYWAEHNFIKDRATLAHEANKPIVMEEYGFSWENDRGTVSSRNNYLQKMHEFANNYGYAGMLVWQLLPHKHSFKTHYSDSDDYDISYNQGEDGQQAVYENAWNLYQKSNGKSGGKNTAVIGTLTPAEKSLHVYPVPLAPAEVLTIDLPQVEASRVEVLEATGKVLLEKQIEKGASKMQLSMGVLSEGTYYLRIYSDEEIITGTIVVK